MYLEIPNEKPTVKAGSQIQLSAKLDRSEKGPKTYRWTIPGKKFKDFDETAESDPLTPFSEEDDEELSKKKPKFYWFDEANNRVVRCDITVKGTTLSGTMSFKVIRPNVTVTATVENGHSLHNNGLFFGTYPNFMGITFSHSLNNNNITGGQYCWTQVIRAGRLYAPPDWPNVEYKDELDNIFKYSEDTITYDHPFVAFANHTEIIQNISADMYLMYKPTGLDVKKGKWIPLKVVHWFANGRAYIDNGWRLSSTNSYSQNPSVKNTETHPVWKAIRLNKGTRNGGEGMSARDE